MAFTPIPENTEPWFQQANDAWSDQDARIDVNAAGIAAQVIVNNDQWFEITNNRDEIDTIRSTYNTSLAGSPFKVANFDPALMSGGTSPGTNGQLYMFRMDLHRPETINGIAINILVAGSAFVANQNFLGIYDSTGALLAQTGDAATPLSSTGLPTIPLLTPVALPVGTYFVALLLNATNRPSFGRGASNTTSADAINLNLPSATARWATSGAALTALPATVNMATRSNTFVAWWTALS